MKNCIHPDCTTATPRAEVDWCREHNPNRCTEVTTGGRRCRNESSPGTDRCSAHVSGFSVRSRRKVDDPVVDFLQANGRQDLAGIVLRLRAENNRLRSRR